jgi:hypothetical protein
MSKLEGKIQGVMILISKYIQKQGCNSGLIEFFSPITRRHSLRPQHEFLLAKLLRNWK